MNRAALARMPACSGARRADRAEPMVLDFPRTRAYPCYYNRVIVILNYWYWLKGGTTPLKGGTTHAGAAVSKVPIKKKPIYN